MASNLKVDELRAQLSQRGLSTSGTKATLVRRLEAVIEEESKKLASKNNGLNSNNDTHGRKRPRGSDNGESTSDGPRKIQPTSELRKMNVERLRKQAFLRGLPTSGLKKEVLERILADVGKSAGDNDQGNGAEVKGADSDDQGNRAEIENCSSNDERGKEETKMEKVVTAKKKGSAVLDNWLPDHIKAHYHVLQVDDEIYDAMLNQTNVGTNNNKFYVIQVLESDDGGKFMVYSRWGRVGVKGQDNLNGPYTSREAATSEFEKKFYDKTKNHWSNRKRFVCYPRTYAWLEMDYSEAKKEIETQGESKSDMKSEPRESKLDARIAKLISLICNVSMMKQQMMEIGYNAEKLPLGKLSKSTILKGYNVLKRIADVIDNPDRKTLEELSGEFYTVIPHDFGFRKMREFVIDAPQKLKAKLEMVEALGEIEVAAKLLNDDIGIEDPLYSHYSRLHCELSPIEVDSEEFSMIERYTKNTHAKTHSSYVVDIVQAFRVSRECEAERFKKFSQTKNRMLLWHGSRLTNWTGILSQGLRIAPPEAPSTGYMFGKGVYFADMFSKSANYCYANSTATNGVLLLCEVALGDMNELVTVNYNADKLPEGKLSTKGVGGTAPEFSEARVLEDGVVVPLGKPKEQQGHKGSLLYNEYIVYNVDQIKMCYLVQVNFNYKRT